MLIGYLTYTYTFLKKFVNTKINIIHNPHKNKKVASPFLFLIYEEYPSNILMQPNNINAIDIAELFMILNMPKTINIIAMTAINVLLLLNFFNLVPPYYIFTNIYSIV